MKRFYKAATVAPDGAILLDERPVMTPAKRVLAAPTAALATALAAEWAAQGDDIVPASMPLNRLANTAIDRVADAMAETRAEVLRYGGTDLVCYRAVGPADLVAAQSAAWDPLLNWLEAAHGVSFNLAEGLMPVAQGQASLARLAAMAAPWDAFALTGLGSATAAAGSLVIALAACMGEITADAAWVAASVDETHQQARWGADAEHVAMLDVRRRDLAAAVHFFALAKGRLP